MASRPKTADRIPGREQRARRALNTFRQIVSSAKRHMVNVGTRFDLSGAQLWALSQVKKQPGLTVQELATSMSVHRSTASNLVEKLASAGLVRKKREVLDRRVVRLHPTVAGSQMLKKAPSRVDGALPDALNRMTEDELKALEESLLVLARRMEQDKIASESR